MKQQDLEVYLFDSSTTQENNISKIKTLRDQIIKDALIAYRRIGKLLLENNFEKWKHTHIVRFGRECFVTKSHTNLMVKLAEMSDNAFIEGMKNEDWLYMWTPILEKLEADHAHKQTKKRR